MTRKNVKPEAPIDPLAAVGPLMAWWFQVVELIDRIDIDCQRIEGQLGRTDSPWRQFVDLDTLPSRECESEERP